MEKCPLVMVGSSRTISMVCLRQCAEIWGDALDGNITHGPYDLYPDENEHIDCDIQYSSEALQVRDGSERIYTIVDECEDHEVETGEQSYFFECPYN